MNRWYWLGTSALALACAEESVEPVATAPELNPLGIYAPLRPEAPLDEAREALLRDARKREARFLEAAEPGFMLRQSSPSEAEVRAGSYDAEALFQFGAQIFHHAFTEAEGLGGADVPFPTRFQRGLRGGAETTSCASCHLRGGAAGAGDASGNSFWGGDGERPATGLSRNARALTGAGFIELLAKEMTAELSGLRESCRLQAKASASTITLPLSAKGVSFGQLGCRADGTLDTSKVAGVDATLEVRPFGWKGVHRTIRDAVEDELRLHMGLQSSNLVQELAEVPALIGPNGGEDPDGDGVVEEISEGQLDVLTSYLALSEVPIVELPQTSLAPVSLWAEGRQLFEQIGCASCHVPALELTSSRYSLSSRSGMAELSFDLALEGAQPKPERSESGKLRVQLFSDLKRHDLGSKLAEPRADRGVDGALFLTPPLWEIARTRPYLHDGRAPTLHDAIVAHEGEASAARDQYVALGEAGQGPLRVFLVSLTRQRRYAVP
jgi:mono/diheme cytochrome c family protein